MFSNYTRIIFGLICFILGCFSLSIENYFLGVILILYSIFSVYLQFAYGTVWKAFQKIKRNDFVRAKKELESIKKPDLLLKSQKGYYYWSLGIISSQEKDLLKAEEYIIKAIDYGVRTDNDMALLNFSLAQILYQRELIQEAKLYLDKAKNIPHKSIADKYINDFENLLNDSIPK